MGALGDLTILANVKAWRSPPLATTIDDAQIARIISAASAFILRYLGRPLLWQSHNETRNGSGGRALMLRHAPVTAIAALSVDGIALPAAPDAASAGYVLDGDPGMLYLRGYGFSRGVQNITCAYNAGYLVSGEAQTIPAAPGQLPCSALVHLWAGDGGIVYAGGAALTALPPGSIPGAGQYGMPAAPDGFYSFAAADAGRAIALSYSNTPADIEQACVELCLLRINERGRIGEASKTLGGEVVAFSQRDITASIATALAPYRRVVPLL